MFFFELCVVCVLGLVFGSFTTALVHRIPQGINWVSRRSACPACHHPLGPLDLVPVFSWAFSKGQCRHCKAPVSMRYPAIELLVLGLCLLVYAIFGFTVEALFLFFTIPVIVALIVIDLDHMILPNQLVLIVGATGLARLFYLYVAGIGDIIYALIVPFFAGALVYGGLSWFLGWFLTKILKKDALGFGDVKFFIVAGLWLGVSFLPHFLIISGLLGVCFALLWRIMGKGNLFPFGPALIATFFLLLLVQGPILI